MTTTAKRLRVAHFSDTHIGYRKFPDWKNVNGLCQRTEDFDEALFQAVDQIIAIHKQNPFDLIVHSGDIFDSPIPRSRDLLTVTSALNMLLAETDALILLIAGNHDMAAIRVHDTPLAVLKNAYRHNDRIQFEISRAAYSHHGESFAVDLVPHGCESDDLVFSDIAITEGFKLAVAHGDLVDSVLYQDGVDIEFVETYDYVFLGHQHITWFGVGWQQAGSTERSGWRDYEATPGWVEVELVKGLVARTVLHPISARDFYDLGDFDFAAFDTSTFIDNIIDHAKDAANIESIARLTVTNCPPEQTRLITSTIREEIGSKFAYLQVDTMTPMQRSRVEISESFASADAAVGLPPLEVMLIEYIESRQELGAAFVEQLKVRGIAALNQAIESDREAATV